MKSVLHILLVTILFTLSSVWGQAQTTSTPFTHRDISGELPSEWSFNWLDAEEDKDEYMFIAANKDRDRLFVFVSKPANGAYTQSRFEEGVKHFLDGAKNISISKVKELTFNKQKVYKTNVYQDGELFRIAYGSIVDNIEYYVLLDLLNPKQADQLFRKVQINQAKPSFDIPEVKVKPLSELKEMYPDTPIPKDAVVHKFGGVQIWFDADDFVKIENNESFGKETVMDIAAVSQNIGCELGVVIADFSNTGIKEMTPSLFKYCVTRLLNGLSKSSNIRFEELQEAKFKERFCYTTLGFQDGILDGKMIITHINSTIYLIFSANSSNLNAANEILSRVSIIE